MFKTVMTLFRGLATERVEEVTNANALPILRQQLRDCAETIASAKRSLAIAMAQNKQESDRNAQLSTKISELENRTVIAIREGKQEIARQAAETLAILEAEKATSAKAESHFASEIERQTLIVRQAEMKLRELERGQRLAQVTSQTQKLRVQNPKTMGSSLKDAEATLEKLQQRQNQAETAYHALEGLNNDLDADAMLKKLSDVGCGPAQQTNADAILQRLAATAATSEVQ